MVTFGTLEFKRQWERIQSMLVDNCRDSQLAPLLGERDMSLAKTKGKPNWVPRSLDHFLKMILSLSLL